MSGAKNRRQDHSIPTCQGDDVLSPRMLQATEVVVSVVRSKGRGPALGGTNISVLLLETGGSVTGM